MYYVFNLTFQHIFFYYIECFILYLMLVGNWHCLHDLTFDLMTRGDGRMGKGMEYCG